MPDPATTPSTQVLGVVWDFGGVLIDWDPFPAVATALGEREAARFFAEFDFHSWNLGPDAGQGWDEALADLEASHPHFLPHGRAYREHFAHALVGEVAGTADIVRELHHAGVRQLGLTNWSDELYHAHAPARFDVLALLEHVVVSGTERIAKPDPAIYRLLEERSGLPLQRLVFVDDREANVGAARELGMDGIVFTDADDVRAELRERGLPV